MAVQPTEGIVRGLLIDDRYQRIKAVFHAACEQIQDERSVFLEQACGDDPVLRAEVEALLTARDQQPDFLNEPVVAADYLHDLQHSSLAVHEGLDSIPSVIGRYRILRRLGEGGMGSVYEAQQDAPSRRVALKVVRPGLVSHRILQRFDHEVEILGRLQHPGIAQIYEAGVAEVNVNGAGAVRHPFFAMEFVEGLTLIRHVESNAMGVRERLEMFAAICDAVHYGHQRGIIHRDLKPANILVTPAGDPKVIDFGVARVTDADRALVTLHTDAGQVLGTLAYMSPEQVCGDSTLIDTRSDVYALGVLGYEMLTGKLPYDLSGKLIPDAARMIQDEEPSSLSSISRVFRGDIETIIGKALEKEPQRRYQSAHDLATDIRRYLHDEAIVARPPTLRYQLGKFARRHKELVAGLTLVFLVLVAGVIGTSVELIRATSAREAAQRQARIAEHVSAVLTNILASAEPGAEGGGRDVRVVDLLDQATAQLTEGLSEEPEIEMSIRLTLAQTYSSLLLWDKAIENLQRALELADGLFGPNSPQSIRIEASLVDAMASNGNPNEAEQVCRPHFEFARQRYGQTHELTRRLQVSLARAIGSRGGFDEANTMNRELIGILRELPQSESRDMELVHALTGLAWNLERLYQPHSAASALREALELERVTVAEKKFDRGGGRRSLLAKLEVELGHAETSAALYCDILKQQRALYGDSDLRTISSIRVAADSLCRSAQYEQAVPLLEEYLAHCRIYAQQMPDHFADALWASANALAWAGRDAQAVTRFQEMITLRRSTFGDSDEKAITAWRDANLALGLRAHEPWTSEAMRIMVNEASGQTLSHIPRTFTLDEVNWPELQFQLSRLSTIDNPQSSSTHSYQVIRTGTYSDIRAMSELEPGLYKLDMELPIEGSDPSTIHFTFHVARWRLNRYEIDPDKDGPIERWPEVFARTPDDSVELPMLRLGGPGLSGQGPHGKSTFFALTAEADLELPAGAYTLSVSVDDGARVWLGQTLIVDSWKYAPARTETRSVELSGAHDHIRVEYFQGVGASLLALDLEPAPPENTEGTVE